MWLDFCFKVTNVLNNIAFTFITPAFIKKGMDEFVYKPRLSSLSKTFLTPVSQTWWYLDLGQYFLASSEK